MKKILCSGLIILSVMLILPLCVIEKPVSVSAVSTGASVPKAEKAKSVTFRVRDAKTDKITEMTAEDYIFGVVAAEMPALYETEALKAQAVAAYTFACRRCAENASKDYDITTDYTVDQSFISENEVREKWGSKADEYCKKIKDAVNDVKNVMLTYDGKPILAVYHAISSGRTEASADIWGKDMPYLKAAASLCDKLSPDYISVLELSAEEFRSGLSKSCEFSGEPSGYIGKCERTPSGTVKKITVCGTEINGSAVRNAFSLRSGNFEVKFKDGKFRFTVYGYGHGVGMSQYGADYMAKQGSDYKEILTHYYSGCKIEKIS